jgi:hypothetical protein
MTKTTHATGDLLTHCHAYIPGIDTAYGYVPTFAAGIVYCVLFGAAFCIQLFRGVKYRRWTCYCLLVGSLVECIGWAGRTWNSKCPYNKTAFLTQISTLVIAPIFFAAAIYLILARLIVRRGPHFSLLKPKAYLWVFCSCDFVSLFIQAAGGGLASAEANTNKSTKPGTHFIVAGILFQLLSMTVFSACFAFFIYRSKHIHTPRNEKLVIGSMTLALVCVYIRSAYRTVELFQGWTGYLISHERFFVALDAAMMVIAAWSLNILDPAVLLNEDDKEVFLNRGIETSHSSATEVEEQRVEVRMEK